MNNETTSPDKLDDVNEVINKIHDIFDQYDFLPSEGAATALTILERIGEMQIERGAESDIICDGLKEACERVIHHIRTFGETQKK